MEKRDLPSTDTIFWFILTAECSLVLVASLLGWLMLQDPFPYEMRLDPDSVAMALVATLPLIAYAVLATSELGLRFGPFRGIYERVRELMGDSLCEMARWQLALLALAAGFGEEILFRGVLQVKLGLWWSSLIFALLHALTPAYFCLAFALSAYLGWIYNETGNILVPSLIHALYDAAALVLLRRKFLRDPPEGRLREDDREWREGSPDDGEEARDADGPPATRDIDELADGGPEDAES